MPVSNNDILKTILLQELDRMEPETSTFEDDPMQFILKKYAGLKNTLEYLMTPSFEEYITGIYVVAPKPTTFKVVLHNGQFFFLQFMGKAYEATVEGRKYYLMSIGEKERCMVAISRLLRYGNPLKTKGPDGAEQATRDSEGPTEEAGPTPPAESSAPEAGEEELTESRILEAVLKEADTKRASIFELALVLAWYDIFKPGSEEVYTIGGLDKKTVKLIKSDKSMYNGAFNAVNTYKNEFKGESAYKVDRKSTKTTSFWKKFGAIDNTPKTDVVLGSARVSVKAGTAQLLSAGKNESEATLAAAVKSAPGIKDSDEFIKLQNIISQFVKVGYTKSGSVGSVLKTGKDKTINKAEALHKEAMEVLKQLLADNKGFKVAFTKEAMSGAKKFGKNSPACAEYVLSTSANFTNPKLHLIDNSYAEKVGNAVKIQVRFKSTSEKIKKEKTGRYRYWSALSGIIDPSKVQESDLTEEDSDTTLPVDVDIVGNDSVNFDV